MILTKKSEKENVFHHVIQWYANGDLTDDSDRLQHFYRFVHAPD